jgi:hypothetical protein
VENYRSTCGKAVENSTYPVENLWKILPPAPPLLFQAPTPALCPDYYDDDDDAFSSEFLGKGIDFL